MKNVWNIAGCSLKCGKRIEVVYDVPGTKEQVPLTLINGCMDGKTVLITAGVHGGEYTGIQSCIELAAELHAEEISGQLILIHPVNMQTFSHAALNGPTPEDGKNLNKIFPGRPEGLLPRRIAYMIWNAFLANTDFYIDMHGGGLQETLVPHVYYANTGSRSVIKASLKRKGGKC